MATGIVGIGNMGRPIAEHLSEVGETLVLWNRSPEKAEGIPNSIIASTPRAVAEGIARYFREPAGTLQMASNGAAGQP